MIAWILSGLSFLARNPANLKAILEAIATLLIWVKTTQAQLQAAGTLSPDEVKSDAQLAAAVGLEVQATALEQRADELIRRLES